MNKLKEGDYEVLYDPQTDEYIVVAKKESYPKLRYSDSFYIVAGLAVFAMIGPDIGYLLGVTTMVGIAVLGWYLTIKATNNRLAAILGGLLLMVVIATSNLDENLFAGLATFFSTLQRTSLVLIAIGAVLLGSLARRK